MIKRALLSVSDKSGLIEFARFLAGRGVDLLSTGGTAKALRDVGIKVTDVSEYTGFPEIMDGRVKTLHPKIHGGLLGRRDSEAHAQAMQAHSIALIDLVAINLYPFERTVAGGAGNEECIENIDIGGPSMIRSAAKNHASVTVITDPADYEKVMREMEANNGTTTAELRFALAVKAFARTAAYDSAISSWFAKESGQLFPEQLGLSAQLKQILHYGENPHQQAAFYITGSGPSATSATQLQGAPLSYNNVNDTDAALACASEFDRPAVVIVKHANPCGVAVGETLAEAYQKALACDTVSAYGGIIAVNRKVDKAFAEAIGKLFVEVLIAPEVDEAALPLLAAKKKLRLLACGAMPDPKRPRMVVKSVQGGLLYQEEDTAVFNTENLKIVTKAQPSAQQMQDLEFAFTVAKHVKSNAIVLAKGGATIGIGAGQMSRIDSTNIACSKARAMGLELKGAVLASDAFFPFSDNVELAAKEGIAAIIQPGGSIRDDEVIAAADRLGLAMVFTSVRHFRH